MELKIDAEGIQFMLFYLGKVFPTMMSLLAWSQSLSLLLNRKKIAKLMEDILTLEIEVRLFKLHHNFTNETFPFSVKIDP